jgi:hypothetical protein
MLVDNTQKRHTNLAQLANLSNYTSVPLDLVERSCRTIPAQIESWSCGANASASFAVMLRQSPDNYLRYLNTTPTYYNALVNLGAQRVGPNGGRLVKHVRTIMCDSDVGSRGGDRWEDQKFIIDRALGQGRPALVLLCRGRKDLHWSNVIGYHKPTDRYTLLDTNRTLYTLPAAQLEKEMLVKEGLVRSFNFVSDYNSITCTEACAFRDVGPDHWKPLTAHFRPFPDPVDRDSLRQAIRWAVMVLQTCNPFLSDGVSWFCPVRNCR